VTGALSNCLGQRATLTTQTAKNQSSMVDEKKQRKKTKNPQQKQSKQKPKYSKQLNQIWIGLDGIRSQNTKAQNTNPFSIKLKIPTVGKTTINFKHAQKQPKAKYSEVRYSKAKYSEHKIQSKRKQQINFHSIDEI
jgi:hypothetical protein